jgi:membrane protein
MVSSHFPSAGDKGMEIPVRIAQTRTRRAREESRKGLNRQILSTSTKDGLLMLRSFSILYGSYLRFLGNDGWAIASHITLSMLTMLFPFLIFLTALAGFVGKQEIGDDAVRLLFEGWPRRVADPLSAEIHSVLTQPRGELLTIGVVLAIYFSSNAVGTVRIALNRAYDAHEQRQWFLLRLEAIFFVFVSALLLLAIAFLLVFAPLAVSDADRYAPPLMHLINSLDLLMRYGVAPLMLGAGLFAAHIFLPAKRPPLMVIAPGIILTLLAWLGFGVGFGAYLAHFAHTYVSTYAGLASMMITIVFLNTLVLIFIFCAELNQTISLHLVGDLKVENNEELPSP